MLIKSSKGKGHLKGIHMDRSMYITQFLLMDDIMFFCIRCVKKMTTLKELFYGYCRDINMEINQNKSLLLFIEMVDNNKEHAMELFLVKS